MSSKVLGIQVFIALFYLLEFTNADTLEEFYPVSTNCFKGIERKNEESAKQYDQILHDECKEENPDEGFLCQKFCIVTGREMLWPKPEESMYNYTLMPDSAVVNAYRLLGISDWDKPEDYLEPEKARLTELFAKCDELNFIVPGHEYVKCRYLAPEHREKLEKLIDCLENALKC